MERNVCVIINPSANRGRTAAAEERVRDCFDSFNIPHAVILTRAPGHAAEIAAGAAGKNGSFTDIIAVGGDGTLNEVINGAAGNKIDIGIIPAGSGNDFIKSFTRKKRSLPEWARAALFSPSRAIDAGICNGRYFINGVGIGFDGEVVAARKTNNIGGFVGYLLSVLKLVVTYREQNYSIHIDKEEFNGRYFLITIGNGTTFGGGFRLTPEAVPDDGLLDICLIKKIGLLKRYINIPKAVAGKHKSVREVSFLKAGKLRIKADKPLNAHFDGESYKSESFDIPLLPGFVSMRLPT